MSDRMAAARLMAHTPATLTDLLSLAKRDASFAVRVRSIRSLTAQGLRLKVSDWAEWVDARNDQPHPAIRGLLEDPSVVALSLLEQIALSDQLASQLRVWALEAASRRDEAVAEQLAIALINNASCEAFKFEAFEHLKNPFSLAMVASVAVESHDPVVREAFCRAALRTHAMPVTQQVNNLASDTDPRVRVAALAAMRRLGGFDSIEVAPAMRPIRHGPVANAIANLNLQLAS